MRDHHPVAREVRPRELLDARERDAFDRSEFFEVDLRPRQQLQAAAAGRAVRCRGNAASERRLDEALHVVARDAAVGSAAAHRAERNAEFAREPPDRGTCMNDEAVAAGMAVRCCDRRGGRRCSDGCGTRRRCGGRRGCRWRCCNGGRLDDGEHVAGGEHEVLLARVLHLGAAVLAVQHDIPDLDVEGHALGARVVETAGAHRQDFALLGLLLGSVRDY